MLKYTLKTNEYIYVFTTDDKFYQIPYICDTAFVINNNLYIDNDIHNELLKEKFLINKQSLLSLQLKNNPIDFKIKSIEFITDNILKIVCDKYIKAIDLLPFYENVNYNFKDIKIINNTIGWGTNEFDCYDICPSFISNAPYYNDVKEILNK